jgi:hypothetical protein
MKRITDSEIKCDFLRKKVIATSTNNNTWFGTVASKKGKEVLLINARHLQAFLNAQGRGLSATATAGIDPYKSRIDDRVEQVWLDASEIILCTDRAIRSIESAPVLN